MRSCLGEVVALEKDSPRVSPLQLREHRERAGVRLRGAERAMMPEEDPFTLVQVPRRPSAHPCASRLLRARHRSRRSQEEASRSLLDVQAQLAHWRELSSSTSEMDHTEANQVKVHLTATIGELQVRAPSPLRPAPPPPAPPTHPTPPPQPPATGTARVLAARRARANPTSNSY